MTIIIKNNMTSHGVTIITTLETPGVNMNITPKTNETTKFISLETPSIFIFESTAYIPKNTTKKTNMGASFANKLTSTGVAMLGFLAL